MPGCVLNESFPEILTRKTVNKKVNKMWFIYASLVFGVIAFTLRRFGLNFYQRFGRPLFIRRIVGKTRPATPPLDDRRQSKEHSVFQVYDDGTIISSKIEKPQMVIEYCEIDWRWWIAQYVAGDKRIAKILTS